MMFGAAFCLSFAGLWSVHSKLQVIEYLKGDPHDLRFVFQWTKMEEENPQDKNAE